MNFEQIRRLNIEEPKDMKMFIECLDASDQAIVDDGPANFTMNWIDAILSDEELSFKVWILTLAKIKKYLIEDSKGVEIQDFKRIEAYITSLKSLINEMDLKTIPFMHNTRKWQSILFIEFDITSRIAYYALNEFLITELSGTDVQLMGFNQFLEKEPSFIKIGVKAYSQFIKTLLK